MTALINRADVVRDRLVTISKTAAELVYENGTLLREIRDNGYYREWGYDSFEVCITAMQDAGQLDYGPRNARHFIRIVTMIEATGIPIDQLGDIGVSKLREIACVPVLEEQKQLLAAAPAMTTSEVQREAKRLRDIAFGNDVDPLHPLTLMTTETGRIFFRECITSARQIYAISDDVAETGILIDAILADWYTSIALPQMPALGQTLITRLYAPNAVGEVMDAELVP